MPIFGHLSMGNKWWKAIVRAFPDIAWRHGPYPEIGMLLMDMANCERHLERCVVAFRPVRVFMAFECDMLLKPWAKWGQKKRKLLEDFEAHGGLGQATVRDDLAVSRPSSPVDWRHIFADFLRNNQEVRPIFERAEFIQSREIAPLEAEHKMVRYLLKRFAEPDFEPSTSAVMVSRDGDVGLLALQSPIKNMYLFRRPQRKEMCAIEGKNVVVKKDREGITNWMLFDIDLLRLHLAEFFHVAEESILAMCEDVASVLGILENDYVPNYSAELQAVLNVLKNIYRKDPDCHVFQDGLINVKFFRQFFSGLTKVGHGGQRGNDGDIEEITKKYLQTLAWMLYTNRGECPSFLQYYHYIGLPPYDAILKYIDYIGIKPDEFPKGWLPLPGLAGQETLAVSGPSEFTATVGIEDEEYHVRCNKDDLLGILFDRVNEASKHLVHLTRENADFVFADGAVGKAHERIDAHLRHDSSVYVRVEPKEFMNVCVQRKTRGCAESGEFDIDEVPTYLNVGEIIWKVHGPMPDIRAVWLVDGIRRKRISSETILASVVDRSALMGIVYECLC